MGKRCHSGRSYGIHILLNKFVKEFCRYLAWCIGKCQDAPDRKIPLSPSFRSGVSCFISVMLRFEIEVLSDIRHGLDILKKWVGKASRRGVTELAEETVILSEHLINAAVVIF